MNAVSKLNVVNADSGCVQVNVSKLNVANADSECCVEVECSECCL